MRPYVIVILALSFLTMRSQKVKLISTTPGATIKELSIQENMKLLPHMFNYKNLTDTLMIGKDSGELRLVNEANLVIMQKSGYRNKTAIVLRGDAGSKKRIRLSAMEPIPKKEADALFIDVNKIGFKVLSKDCQKRFYDDYPSFIKGNMEHSSTVDEGFIVENSIFVDTINTFLKDNGFIYTQNKLSLSKFKRITIDMTVTNLSQYHIGAFSFLELATKVTILDPWSPDAIYENTFVTSSNIGFIYASHESENHFYPNDNPYFRSQISEALENTIIEFLKDSKFKNVYLNFEKKENATIAAWPTISVTAVHSETINLEEAVNSVITVTQKNSHGSGCIISNNGYIVTNYHVVGPDTSETYILFSSGAKKRAKVVRFSTLYDLALLKVDTTLKTVLKINFDKKISVGADVFAIGTPQDYNLGQSVTKGIISGKRNLDNRIYIQSDVSVNGGNSGGAMTNKDGELIGIVVAKLVGTGVEGIGFAIPAYYIEEVLKIKIDQKQPEVKAIETKQPDKKPIDKKKK